MRHQFYFPRVATGEPSTDSAFALVLAMRDAIASARADVGNTEWFEMSKDNMNYSFLNNFVSTYLNYLWIRCTSDTGRYCTPLSNESVTFYSIMKRSFQ